MIVTIIADNYYGYCKKEVKTQISYAANLYGMCEEEHAGGALAFRNLRAWRGIHSGPDHHRSQAGDAGTMRCACSATAWILRPEGYAVDRQHPHGRLRSREHAFQCARGLDPLADAAAIESQLSLRPEDVYVLPSGYRVQHGEATRRNCLAARRNAAPRALLCHKPCTVSGGGKSEISKSIAERNAQRARVRPELP